MADFVARAGQAVISRLSNAQAEVAGQLLSVHLRQTPELVSLGAALAQSSSLTADLLLSEVEALPVDLCDGSCVTIAGQCWTVVQRTDRPLLGQVQLRLELAP